MNLREIQRLAAASITPALYESLAAHGEDLLVERKARLPEAEKLGAEVASMANMLGGWVLLGVNDKTRAIESPALPAGVDLQSHIGHLLRNAVDPVPPFLADTLAVNEIEVGYVRVFESSIPVLVSGSGSVYIRDAGGKLPISDHRVLLELAHKGRAAEQAAGMRAHENEQTQIALGIAGGGQVGQGQLRSVVRAAPLTVTPQLSDWPISAGPGRCMQLARQLAEVLGAGPNAQAVVQPFGRGVVARSGSSPSAMQSVEATTVADCVGLVGAAALQPVNNVVKTHDFRRRFIRPLVDAVADLLEAAEAFGDSVLDLNVLPGRTVSLQDEAGRYEGHDLPRWMYCGSTLLGIPADDEDRTEIGRRWEREIAREVGIAMWESPIPGGD